MMNERMKNAVPVRQLLPLSLQTPHPTIPACLLFVCYTLFIIYFSITASTSLWRIIRYFSPSNSSSVPEYLP